MYFGPAYLVRLVEEDGEKELDWGRRKDGARRIYEGAEVAGSVVPGRFKS